MKIYVGVTDNDWFRFLSDRPDLDEVNFWQPGGSHRFKALQPGEPFLFKLHAPENFIAGGGFLAHFSLVQVSLAWEAFREKNGVASFQEMRNRIEHYRRTRNSREDFVIGCIILRFPFFFREFDWLPAPRDFSPNIPGKTYDADHGTGKELWDALQYRLHVAQPEQVGELGQVYFQSRLIHQRLGQGSFRLLVTDTYQRRCAITREKALPALEAAHIRPIAQDGKHRLDNGLLLRSDIHRLFDSGYVTVTPDYHFRASRKLKDDFDNGEEYFQLQDNKLWLPGNPHDRPNREFLEWHSDTVFRG